MEFDWKPLRQQVIAWAKYEWLCFKWSCKACWQLRGYLGLSALATSLVGLSMGLLVHFSAISRWPALKERAGEPMDEFLLFIFYTLAPPVAFGFVVLLLLLVFMPSKIHFHNKGVIQKHRKQFRVLHAAVEMLASIQEAAQLASDDCSLADAVKWKHETIEKIKSFDEAQAIRFGQYAEVEIKQLDLNSRDGIDEYLNLHKGLLVEIMTEVGKLSEAANAD